MIDPIWAIISGLICVYIGVLIGEKCEQERSRIQGSYEREKMEQEIAELKREIITMRKR